MGCNCGDNEYNVTVSNNGNCEPTTPIYNITLANVGVNGYSPIVRFINETVESFNIAVDNVTGTETSPAVPKLSYVTDQINSINSTIANLGSTYLTRNGSNASSVVTFNGITMQSNVLYGNNSLSLRNKLNLDSYINLTEAGVGVYADVFKYNGEDVLTTSSITNKLDKDGSNTANPIILNHLTMGYQYGSPYINSDSNLYIRGAVLSLQATSDIQLSTTGTNKAYYNNKEIATVDDIPDVSTKLNTDGSNADNYISLKNITIDGNISSYNTNFYISNKNITRGDITLDTFSGNINLRPDGDIILQNVSGDIYLTPYNKAYYRYNEIATVNQIPTVGNGTITITQGGVLKGTFTTNQSDNTTIDLDAGGGGTSYTAGTGIDITNDTISIDTSVVAQLSDIPDTSDMATQTWVGNQGYLTGITSSDVTTALGYTPYNSSNPNGYITSSALNGYATETWVGQRGYLTNSITENVTIQTGYGLLNSINKNIIKANGNAIIVGNDTNTLGLYGSATRPSYNGNNLALYSDIPTVNNSTITFTQGGTTKGTITLNQSTNQTIALDTGGGGAVIDDTTPSTTTVYSSQKTQDLIDALTARITALENNINGGNA